MVNQFSTNLNSLTPKMITSGMKTLPHLAALAVALFLCVGTAHAQAGFGAIVVSSDEWVFEDGVIDYTCCQDTLFAMNIAKFLVPLGGSVLIQSSAGPGGYGQGLNGANLKALLTSMGATVVEANVCPPPCTIYGFCWIGLQPFDAIFVSGDPTSCYFSPADLATYVEGGGHVFLEAGTGCCGGAAGEAAAWNPLLAPFGLTLNATGYNGICLFGCGLNVSAFQSDPPFGHSLFANTTGIFCFGFGPCGVNALWYSNGQDISTISLIQPGTVQVFYDTNLNGLYGVWKGCNFGTQSSISALVNRPYGTAYLPSAEWFSPAPNVSQAQVDPGGQASFGKQTMMGTEPVASCASNPV